MEKINGQRDWMTAVVLSSFFGVFGVDRFYLGRIGSGILKLLTFGGFGVWAVVDNILIIGNEIPDSRGILPYKKKPPVELVESGQVSEKEWIVALMYSIFTGWLGADRFYLGYKKIGFIKLVSTLLGILSFFTFIINYISSCVWMISSPGSSVYRSLSETYMPLSEVIIYISIIAIFTITSIMLWVIDLILIGMNKVTDVEGKRLWKQ